MSLIQEYFELTKKYQLDYGPTTILLMQVGSFFEVYGFKDKKTELITGSNIEAFARICDLNMVEKNVCVSNSSNLEVDVLMAGFKDIQIEKYIKKIQEASYTAVVFVQDEAAKNTTRSCAGIFSPGTYFSNDSQLLSNNISCIWIDVIENKMLFKGKHVFVGIATIDILTGKSNLYQFKEMYTNNPTDFDALEHFISIYKPSEIVCISNLMEKEIQTILNYINIHCLKNIHILSLNENALETSQTLKSSEQKNQFLLKAKNCEKQVYQKEILNTFYKKKDYEILTQHFYDHTIATQSFCFLLDFVYQHNPYLVYKLEDPIFENCSTKLLLANHSLKQLNILDDKENSYAGNYSSVLKMLNICITPMGKRKFQQLFLNPTFDTNYLKKEYDITDFLLNDLDKKVFQWKSKLGEIKDLSKWERQIYLKKMTPRSFYQLYQNIKNIQELWLFVYLEKEIVLYLENHIKNISFISNYCDQIIDFLEKNFQLEILKEMEVFQGFETNFICKGINAALDEKNAGLKECEFKLESIRIYLSNCIENKEKKTKNVNSLNDFVKMHETEKNNCNLITTNRRGKLLQDALPEKETIVALSYDLEQGKGQGKGKVFEFKVCKKQFDFPKQSAANCFIQDSSINQLCKSLTQIKISMKEEITAVYQSILYTFGEEFQEKLDTLIQFVTWLDVIFSRAILAEKYHYCKPILCVKESCKSFVKAKKLRHCLIEFLQTEENYVSNDIVLGCDNEDGDSKNGILLYGTNAVGKTSFIKAIGIAIIMAQSGLFVPCSEFIFKPYQAIFTRILGNDNLFKGLSTFAVEMSELRTILRLANENSLVLGDELCSGTENSSAISIFVAGIQALSKAKSSFIFATHLHEIVTFDEIRTLESVSLKHMAVIYDKEKDMLIYDRKLKDGPGNNMYGLEVCKSLHLPDDFIEAAYHIRMKYRNETEVSSVLNLNSSHFNAKKIMGLCEKCGIKIGTEVHHLQHQKEANDKGVLEKEDSIFHKNNLANLITLCETCHHDFHKTKKQHKKVKTTKGIKIMEV